MGVSGSRADTSRIRLGHRVLEVTPGSPGAEAKFVSFLDIIVAINGITLDNANYSLIKMVIANVDKPTTFTIYNTKQRALRDATVVPRRGWGGQGILGLVARYDSFSLDLDDVVVVTDVLPKSPAFDAGLRAHEDIILGAEKITFRDTVKLVEVMGRESGKKVVLYVYHVPTDTVRPVVLIPGVSWEGAGTSRDGLHWKLVGCGLAMGPAHQIPADKRSTPGSGVEMSNVDLLGRTNLSRLEQLGNLMARTVSKKGTNRDPSVPVPPPPPPPLPAPPTHEPEDEDETGMLITPSSPPPGSSSSLSSEGSSSDSGSRSRSDSDTTTTSSSSDDEEEEEGDAPTPLRAAPGFVKKPVMTSAAMDRALKSGPLVRTKGLGTHRMTRGASRRMSEAAAKRAALAAAGRLDASGAVKPPTEKDPPVELMFKTKQQREREEAEAKARFELSNPLLV